MIWRIRRSLALFTACFLFAGIGFARGDVVMTESQVKALCLLNFAKYVTWPQEAFANSNEPIVIGVAGEHRIGEDLRLAVKGKSISGRAVAVRDVTEVEDARGCHILFISASEKGRGLELLESFRDWPVLTVGDSGSFADAGGAIMFVKRENKVRFEVNLHAARRARLQISSKLLALADAVRGKEE